MHSVRPSQTHPERAPPTGTEDVHWDPAQARIHTAVGGFRRQTGYPEGVGSQRRRLWAAAWAQAPPQGPGPPASLGFGRGRSQATLPNTLGAV